MSVDMKKLEEKFTEQRDKIKTQINDLLKSQSEKTDGEITTLKTSLEELDNSIKEIQENVEKAAKAHIPGLSDELKKQKFDFGAFCNAALKTSKGIQEEKAWVGAEFEKEVLDEHAKTMGPLLGRKDMIAGDGTQGGYLIPEEVTSELVGLTIAKMPILELGVTKLEGLFGDLPIPRQTGRPTGYWVGETEAPTESDATFNEFTLRPKKAGAFTKYSKRLAYQTKGTADSIIRESITDALALVVHEGLLQGTGSDSQPKGVLIQTGYTTTPNQSTTAARFRIDKAASMIQAIDVANELVPNGNFGFIMRPEVIGGMRRERVPQFTGQPIGQGQPIAVADILMSNEMLEQRVGYAFKTTTQLSNTQTRGNSSSSSTVIFGNWKQFFVGFWRGMEIKVSDIASDASGNSAFLKDQFYIVAFQEIDSNVGRVSAFTIVEDAETNENLW